MLWIFLFLCTISCLKSFILLLFFLLLPYISKFHNENNWKVIFREKRYIVLKWTWSSLIKQQIHHKSLASWRYFKLSKVNLLSFGSKGEKAKLFGSRSKVSKGYFVYLIFIDVKSLFFGNCLFLPVQPIVWQLFIDCHLCCVSF